MNRTPDRISATPQLRAKFFCHNKDKTACSLANFFLYRKPKHVFPVYTKTRFDES